MITVPIECDYHVHCGQYAETYYQPTKIIKALHENGIKRAWISSTTSCISWESENEKKYIVQHIEDELTEALHTALECCMELTPLYWVLPQRKREGESIADVMYNSVYKGFKIHPRNDWNREDPLSNELMREVCTYASEHRMPVLIHTGVDLIDSPARFERFFAEFGTVKFVLAHCKEKDEVISIFSKYLNVYGDVSFCPKENYDAIKARGYVICTPKVRQTFGGAYFYVKKKRI